MAGSFCGDARGHDSAASCGGSSSGSLRTTKPYIQMKDSNIALAAIRDEAQVAFRELEKVRATVETQRFGDMKKAWDRYQKTGKLPQNMPKGVEITENTRVVVRKRKGQSGFEEYQAYREGLKKYRAQEKRWSNQFEDFIYKRDEFMRTIPKEGLPIGQKRLVDHLTARRIHEGHTGRFRIHDPETGRVTREYPRDIHRRNSTIQRDRADVERAIATAGRGVTLEEMATRFANYDKFHFVPANHIRLAGIRRMVKELDEGIAKGQIDDITADRLREFEQTMEPLEFD